jgi:copper ion binding protein
MESTTLHAPDISCHHCVMAIKKAVGKLEGVSSVEADVATKNVQVTFDPAKVELVRIKEVMADEGYPVSN